MTGPTKLNNVKLKCGPDSHLDEAMCQTFCECFSRKARQQKFISCCGICETGIFGIM